MQGRTYGGYRLERRLGAGAVGEVWLGEHEMSGGLAAVKLLQADARISERARNFFAREGRMVARLRHPNIVPFYGSGNDYLLTAFVLGTDLKRRLRTPIAPSDAVKIARALASALEHAHEQGVVHRDVKPSNVLLDTTGQAYLVDFGLATLLDEGDTSLDAIRAGTPGFMAPEQWRTGRVTPAADQFALGRTLRAMLSGGCDPDAPLPSTLPAALIQIVERATATDPRQRWPSVAELARQLSELELSQYPPVFELAPVARSARPLRWLGGVEASREIGIDIEHADYRLSVLEAQGLLDGEAVRRFREETGIRELGWSAFCYRPRLGSLRDGLAGARAGDVLVLLHSNTRSLWSWTATRVCQRSAQTLVLVPDIMGFGESRFCEHPAPPEVLAPAATARAILRWLELLSLREHPTVLIGHSMATAALMSISDEEAGRQTSRILYAPFFPRINRGQARRMRLGSSLLRLIGDRPGIRRLVARAFVRFGPDFSSYDKTMREAWVEQLVTVDRHTLAGLFDAFADVQPRAAAELRNSVMVLVKDDGTIPEAIAERALAELAYPYSKVRWLPDGAHLAHTDITESPERVARNVDDLAATAEIMLAAIGEAPVDLTDTGVLSRTLDHLAREESMVLGGEAAARQSER